METDVTFENHLGEKLFGTYRQPDVTSDKGIALGHCFTCTRHTGILRETGARLADAGFHVLRFDFSGNGQSEGVFIETSYSKYVKEMGVAADFLRSRSIKWVGFAGHSMGAAVSVLASAKVPEITAVCAVAGRLTGMDPTRIFSEAQKKEFQETGILSFVSRGRQLELDTRFLTDMLSHDMLKAVADMKAPLLIVHGDRDEIVPVDQAEIAHKANLKGSEIEIINGADHFFSIQEHREKAARIITDWFVRILMKR